MCAPTTPLCASLLTACHGRPRTACLCLMHLIPCVICTKGILRLGIWYACRTHDVLPLHNIANQQLAGWMPARCLNDSVTTWLCDTCSSPACVRTQHAGTVACCAARCMSDWCSFHGQRQSGLRQTSTRTHSCTRPVRVVATLTPSTAVRWFVKPQGLCYAVTASDQLVLGQLLPDLLERCCS